MYAISKKQKEFIFEEVLSLNKAIKDLSSDLDVKGVKFTAEDWNDLLSGFMNIREFVYLKWTKENFVQAFNDCMQEMKKGVPVSVPNVLGENMPVYETLFGKKNYKLLYDFVFDKKGVPFVDVAKMMKMYDDMFAIYMSDLTNEELNENFAVSLELTSKLQKGQLSKKYFRPGFRIVGQKVVFTPEDFYSDMADLIYEMIETPPFKFKANH